jgi:hypothetical protein
MSFFVFVPGRRSSGSPTDAVFVPVGAYCMVASIGVLWLRDTSSLVSLYPH